MKSKTVRRLSLLSTIGVSLLAVFSASICTFAWFQANASVTVQAESSSTTITVSRPDDFTYWAYNGNGDDSYSPASPENFATDFTQISSGSSATSLTGLGPGQKMLFAVQFSDVTSMTFAIKSIVSNNSSKQSLALPRKVAGSGTPGTLINIGWAIDIYTADSTNGTGYTTILGASSGDKFNVSADSDANNWAVNTTANATGITYNSTTKTITYATPKNIFTKVDATVRATYYVFYMVKFSNSNTTYYQELKTDSVSGEELEFPNSNASARYFKKNTSGNSNCYAGLNFAIKEIVVTKNGETIDQE